TIPQAGETLRTTGLTSLSDLELARLNGQFPDRALLRPVVPDSIAEADAPSDSRADERISQAEAETVRAKMLRVVQAAVGEFEPNDQIIVQMHFVNRHSVADVARALGLEQKPLYRHIDRLRTRLRKILEGAGWGGDDVRDLLDESEAR
ncbi:MAG TPA: hypothetical protein VF625_15080, partial [Longimicrobium sp.]